MALTWLPGRTSASEKTGVSDVVAVLGPLLVAAAGVRRGQPHGEDFTRNRFAGEARAQRHAIGERRRRMHARHLVDERVEQL